ncbi:hypothetical protein Taro_049696 [Colocasia esculenta]|uniref:Peptidase A1 domain-containing protein n=1 Tax=Colocasia esculenta TaxID=4460 RepID=A0A843XBN6_COLES|nr:hypothetical protein [Colocasia esculenta]
MRRKGKQWRRRQATYLHFSPSRRLGLDFIVDRANASPPASGFIVFRHVEDALLNITSNGASHLLYLSSVVVSTRKTVAFIASGCQVLQSANYVVRICLGKAPQPMLMALDTSNDATWLPCPICAGCPPPSAIFDSTKSSSFTLVPCGDARCNQVPNTSCQGTNRSFNMTYGGSVFQAALSHDTLHIPDDIFPAYTFGSLQKVMGRSVSPQGLLGLGWSR